MATKGSNLILLCLFFFFFNSHISHSDTDTLVQGRELRDGEHLVSVGGTFRLGFFSPGTSTNRYVGISYNKPDVDGVKLVGSRKVVWVANRDNPISDQSGIIMIDEFGNLTISHGAGSLSIIVSSTVQPANNATARLLDSGNFILSDHNGSSDGSTEQVIWQSFDYPTDTLLPGMKLGYHSKTTDKPTHYWLLTSWISENDPANGSFTLTLGSTPGGIQIMIWWQGGVYWNSGNLHNGRFDFLSRLSNDSYNYFSYISNENEVYVMYSSNQNHNLSHYKMDSTGVILDIRGLIPFGDCSFDLNPGCVKQNLPECRNPNDQFEQRKGFMSGEGFSFDQNYNLSLFDCRAKCQTNCSCIAYASTFYNQTRCTIWSNEMNYKESNVSFSKEIYILVTEKEIWKWWIWLVMSMTGAVALPVFCLFFILIKRKLREKEESEAEKDILLCELGDSTTHASRSGMRWKSERDSKKGSVLQFFTFESIAAATNNFATTSKLGEGGFGPVYKGKLGNGQEVAIKRLSRNSGQGPVEFKNELVLIAKLQHTNLIKLVGCCIRREEKILIYEYMQNKSLDFFLFDPIKKSLLDWTKRFNIIQGISQGLLYLHKYSRLKIIHRDLKASNILLDADMNPKISDFGLARIFGQDETEANTRRVVGTFGYMSPEYAMNGTFSMKSDVFSFGVLLIEIVSGKKITSFYDPEKALNLLGYAWELWKEGKCLNIADPTLGDLSHTSEVLRCIHIGLLCVQDSPNHRPSMSDVVSMITNETVSLHPPNQPAFFITKSLPESMAEIPSVNNVSISEMGAR